MVIAALTQRLIIVQFKLSNVPELFVYKLKYMLYRPILRSFVYHDPTKFTFNEHPLMTEVFLQVKHYDYCRFIFFQEKIITRSICAGFIVGGVGACMGDSGSPVSIKVDGQQVVIGFASGG